MSHFWTNISLAAPVNRGGAAYAAQYKKASVTMKAGTRHGPPQVIDIPTVGTPTRAAIVFIKFAPSAAGPGTGKARQVLVASTEDIQVGKPSTFIDSA